MSEQTASGLITLREVVPPSTTSVANDEEMPRQRFALGGNDAPLPLVSIRSNARLARS
jgi:hypothetical protein